MCQDGSAEFISASLCLLYLVFQEKATKKNCRPRSVDGSIFAILSSFSFPSCPSLRSYRGCYRSVGAPDGSFAQVPCDLRH